MGRGVRGFVLVVSLIFLAVLAIIITGLARNTWLQEAMTGGTREKIRAENAAQTAVRYAEYWLNLTGNATVGTNCATGAIATQVCANAVNITSNTPPLSAYTEYAPTVLSVSSSGGSNTYYKAPGYHIQYLGQNTSSSKVLYLITAYGYGGNPNAVAVIQSVFGLTYESKSMETN